MTSLPAVTEPEQLDEDEQCGLVRQIARFFVDSGRVVPGLVVEAGRARACWLPLPAAHDRALLASLVRDDSEDGHVHAASALAARVDIEARHRLARAGVALAPHRPGRRSLLDAWLLALCSPDPWLPASIDTGKARAFAAALDEWVASGAVVSGPGELCLRVHEPVLSDEPFVVEPLLRDRDDPSLLVPVADAWDATVRVAPNVMQAVLAALARATTLAPELAPALDAAAPAGVALDGATFLRFATDRLGPLTDAGIAVLLPSWWSRRRRVALRARSSTRRTPSAGAVVESGLGMGELISFRWEAALGDEQLTKAELRKLQSAAAAKQTLVQVRGQWVQLDGHELDAIIRHVGTTGHATAGDLLRAGLGLDAIEAPDDAPVAGVVADGWLAGVLDDAVHAAVAPITTPATFAGRLRPYQERGVGWLAFLGRLGLGACLADDMGLGKTAQLIATLLADPAPGPTLVVCPVSVISNWVAELERFAPHLSVLVHHGPRRHDDDRPLTERATNHDVVVTTYSLIARDIDHLVAVPWARLVLDEAQQVKNPGTAQTRAVRRLPATRRIALTGTPVENRLSELWSIMQILNPGLLGSATSFRERFSIPIERDQDDDARDLLRRVCAPFVLRRLKTDRSIIDDLPDKIELTEHCPLTREQATLYQAVVDDVLEKATSAEGIDRRGVVLAGIAKLKQVCNHPAHFLGDGSRLEDRSGKLTRVEELLDEIVEAGDRVLCFTQFAEWGELLVPHLTRRYGRAPLWLHGGVSRRARDAMVAEFATPDGPPIFLLSLKAGGTGLNLTAASHVIHLDRWWNPAVENQATDRAYRIGQRRTVLVHKLVSKGTIEERIDAMITAKQALAEQVVGTGEAWITELSTDELRAVISLRAEDFER